MKVAVIGSGYVGTTTAAMLANAGHEVAALDIDKRRTDAINKGKAPFFEAGLSELIGAAIDDGSLTATTSYEEAIPEAEVVFSCVGTPDNPDGSSNLEYVFAAAKEAAPLLKADAIYVQKSTVPAGTGQKLVKELKKHTERNIHYVSNPEFLREGTAIKDTLLFDRVVIGNSKPDVANKVASLYEDVEKHKRAINSIAKLGISAEQLNEHTGSYVLTSLNSAELIKVTSNAFLALKISFANSIAKLADQADADVVEVMDGVGADKRIGRAFLNAGRGYGGGCFPKDVSGLVSSAYEHGVDLNIMTAAQELNSSMPGHIANKVKESFGSLKNKRCAVLGLAFKPGTSDARKSPAVTLANILAHDGSQVSAYDPQAMEEAAPDLRKDIELCDSVDEATSKTDAILVATDWPELKELDLTQVKKTSNADLLVDCMNVFDKQLVEDAGFTYIGVGR